MATFNLTLILIDLMLATTLVVYTQMAETYGESMYFVFYYNLGSHWSCWLIGSSMTMVRGQIMMRYK